MTSMENTVLCVSKNTVLCVSKNTVLIAYALTDLFSS